MSGPVFSEPPTDSDEYTDNPARWCLTCDGYGATFDGYHGDERTCPTCDGSGLRDG